MIYAFTMICMDGWMHPFLSKLSSITLTMSHPIQFFFCFNGESLEDSSLELQKSKHHSTLGMHLLTLRTARYEGITPPTLTFSTYLPTYLPRTPTYSPRYYQGSVRFWHRLETQTPTIIALYPIQHPCWVESNEDFKSPF